MNKLKSQSIYSVYILSILLVTFVFNGCQKNENDCSPEEVAFDLDLDLSKVLDHETTKSTTNLKIYYENYFHTGNLVSYEEFSFLNSSIFSETICLPIADAPTDSLIIAIVLIQNNQETNKEAAIFLNVPYVKTDLNSVKEKITSTYLWDRPTCFTMPTIFQNIESYGEGVEGFDINVAGSFGIGLNVVGDRPIEEIKLMGDESLLDFYELGWCPCSKYYVRFYE